MLIKFLFNGGARSGWSLMVILMEVNRNTLSALQEVSWQGIRNNNNSYRRLGGHKFIPPCLKVHTWVACSGREMRTIDAVGSKRLFMLSKHLNTTGSLFGM